MEELIKNHPNSQCIKVYTGSETIQDPYEKNVEITLHSPTLIDAIVEDLIFSQVEWKLPGVKAKKAKSLHLSKQFRSLIEASQIIEVKENGKYERFEGWRVFGQMQIREEGDLIQVYIYSKTVDTP